MRKKQEFIEIIKDDKKIPLKIEIRKRELTDAQPLIALAKLIGLLDKRAKLILWDFLWQLWAFLKACIIIGIDKSQTNQKLRVQSKWGRRGERHVGYAKIKYVKREN